MSIKQGHMEVPYAKAHFGGIAAIKGLERRTDLLLFSAALDNPLYGSRRKVF